MKPNKFWEIKAKSVDEIDMSIYGDISDTKFWDEDITPKLIKDELDAYPNAKTINVHINSGGGSAFAGVAIYNILARSKSFKNVYVDGLAASAASVIAMAGDKIIMPENSMIMIHKAWGVAIGNSDELLKFSDLLEKLDNNLAEIYNKKSNQDVEKIKEMMSAETWMSGKEAKELGFADEIEESKKVAASITDGILNINSLEIHADKYKNFPSFRAKKVIEITESQAPIITGEDIKKYIGGLKNE